MKNPPIFSICICTYQRPELLMLLLNDIAMQTLKPEIMIVVDGDPSSGEVYSRLLKAHTKIKNRIIYVSSNHANLAYQRYLGWRISQIHKAEIILYFDDDIRLSAKNIVMELLSPFFWEDEIIIATTSFTITGKNWTNIFGLQNLKDEEVGIRDWLTRKLGYWSHLPPGGLSPSGIRKMPVEYPKHPGFGEVTWMLGRVMAFRLDALIQNSFSDDLFALTHIHCGLGEDTFLSRRLMGAGNIACALSLPIEHPGEEPPNSYPIKAHKYGFASAYSRRLINDFYRGFAPPRIHDRLALIKSYLGGLLFAWSKYLAAPKQERFLFAHGYTKGVLRGIFVPPHSKSLTPGINWWHDADLAVAQAVRVK